MYFGTGPRELAEFGVFANLITNPADGSNEGAIVAEIDFAPNVVDINIGDVGHGAQIKLLDLLENRGAGNGLPRVAHEKLKQSIFLGAQSDFVTTALDSVGDAFECEIRDLQNGARRAAATPQDRANASGKLGENERFRNIVVSACIQLTDTLFHFCGGCYDEHGKVRFFGANPAEDFQAHGTRETKVEKDKIVVLTQSQLLRFDAIRDDLHGEMLLMQFLAKEIRERRVIFGDKYAYRFPQTA
jgi:hypothetical protein